MFEAEYKVVSVEALMGLVKVVLREEVEKRMESARGGSIGPSGLVTPAPVPVEMPPSESDLKLMKQALEKIKPIYNSEEEEVMGRMVRAMEKELPGFRQAFQVIEETDRSRGRFIPPMIRSPSLLTLRLSREQYEAMGSPAFDQVITLRLETREVEENNVAS